MVICNLSTVLSDLFKDQGFFAPFFDITSNRWLMNLIIYDIIPQDNSGFICSKELGSLLRTLGYNPTENEVNGMMAAVDVDHNGKVIYLFIR